MTEPEWIEKTTLMLLVGETLADHGGARGLRDEGLLESALGRPQNLYAYEGVTEIARLAAAYGFGIAKNHPFIDGNKRAALIALMTFVELNGHVFKASQIEAFQTILALATGDVTELELAAWVRRNIEAP
ncbi:MAG: type II toxin-antitoxin system death-on-curing family toxin [Alphaproteobacteria bacterium]|nr:type II toxin-antitoxin system death-on-curing family toxin [Alphaproteobacteria bacterium]